jgi:hypothetical protein
LRFLGFLAACTAVALTACSSGGSTGAVPAGQQSLASTLSSTTISSVGRNTSEQADCESETGSRHEHSAARAGLDHDRGDGGDKDHEKSSCCPTSTGTSGGSGGRTGTRDRDRRPDDTPSPCPSATAAPAPAPPPLTVMPTALAIDCSVNQFATLTVAGTPAGLTATVADWQQATVGPPTVVNGNTTFVVTGMGTLPTTIALTDTAGATASVAVTLQNCPWRR